MGHVPWQAVSHGQRLIGQTGREWFGCSILLQWVSKLRMSSLWIHSLRGQMWPMHVYIYICTYIPTYLPTYLPTYVRTYIRTYVHTYIRTYVHTYIRIVYIYIHGQSPPLARADVHHVSEHQKTLCFVGQNAHVHDHSFHLATHSLATCALNVTTSSLTSSSSSTSSTPNPKPKNPKII